MKIVPLTAPIFALEFYNACWRLRDAEGRPIYGAPEGGFTTKTAAYDWVKKNNPTEVYQTEKANDARTKNNLPPQVAVCDKCRTVFHSKYAYKEHQRNAHVHD